MCEIHLGIDFGSTTGFAVLDSTGGRIASGLWKFKNRKGRKTIPDDHEGKRFVDYADRLEWCINRYGVTHIAYERVHRHGGRMTHGGRGGNSGVKTAQLWGAWQGLTMLTAARHGLPITGYYTGTVKATAGNGRYSKDDMLRAANERWTLHITDDNEADALWVAQTHIVKSTPLERKILDWTYYD